MVKIGKLEFVIIQPYDRVLLYSECDTFIDNYIDYKNDFDPVKTGLMLNLKYIQEHIDGDVKRRKKIYPTQENAKVWTVHIIDTGPNLRAMMMFHGFHGKKCALWLNAFSEKGKTSVCRKLYSDGIERALLLYDELG